jgi:hypothetical protein
MSKLRRLKIRTQAKQVANRRAASRKEEQTDEKSLSFHVDSANSASRSNGPVTSSRTSTYVSKQPHSLSPPPPPPKSLPLYPKPHPSNRSTLPLKQMSRLSSLSRAFATRHAPIDPPKDPRAARHDPYLNSLSIPNQRG